MPSSIFQIEALLQPTTHRRRQPITTSFASALFVSERSGRFGPSAPERRRHTGEDAQCSASAALRTHAQQRRQPRLDRLGLPVGDRRSAGETDAQRIHCLPRLIDFVMKVRAGR